MRILLDENLPRRTVGLLQSAGHDVVSVLEVARGISDEEVLDYAVREGRILVTLDTDFGRLIYDRDYRLPPPPGLILFRIAGVPSESRPDYVADVIEGQTEWVGFFWVVGSQNIRPRPFPAQ